MHRRQGLRRVALRYAVALGLSATMLASTAGELGHDLERVLRQGGSHAQVAVIVRFTQVLDPGVLITSDRRHRDNRLWLALRANAARNRAALDPWLDRAGATQLRDLWIVNGVAATLPAAAVRGLAEQVDVARIDLDTVIEGGRSQRTPAPRSSILSTKARLSAAAGAGPLALPAAAAEPAASSEPAAAAWNVAAVNAPALWAMGHTGKGVVVATMDTGADLTHPGLRQKWRGGSNSWFDPHGEEPVPFDAVGHGTQALGVVLGGAGLGVAPDAHWIAVKLYNGSSRARLSDIHAAFQWLMDPDGDPATVDAPDIVNASWALVGRPAGDCMLEFADDLRSMRQAGIVVVFAAGNDGPHPGSSNSPGNNPGVMAVGAVGRELQVTRSSSRGPSACGGAVFPRLVAPGVNVRTADLSHNGPPAYTSVSGSSMAAPHVTGVLALLAEAFPAASVADLEAALLAGAQALGPTGPDNDSGYGLVDARASWDALRSIVDAGLAQPGHPVASAPPNSPSVAAGTWQPSSMAGFGMQTRQRPTRRPLP